MALREPIQRQEQWPCEPFLALRWPYLSDARLMHNPKSLGLNPALPIYVWWLIFAYLPPNCFTAKTQVTYLAGNLFNLQFRAGGTFRLHPHWEGGRGGGKKKFSEGIWGIRGGGDCIPETGVEFGVFAVENWVGCGWGRFRKSIVLLQAEMRRGGGRGIRAALKHPNIVPHPSIHATLSAR